MLKSSILVALFASLASASSDFLCIKRDCGAIPKTSLKVELNDTFTNARALETCIKRANTEGQKRVVVPKGYAFSAMPTNHANLTDVTLQIDGVWEASSFYQSWPSNSERAHPLKGKKNLQDFITFSNCTNLTIKGEGIVDGLGYDWWVREWSGKYKNSNPRLLQMYQVQTGEITGVKWLNSPRFNIHLQDIDSFYVHDFEIRTDVLRQKAWISEEHKPNDFGERFNDFVYKFMLHFFHDYEDIVNFFFSGKTEWDSWPTMPLNTDGIDPSGSNVTIKNIKITNWDDAIAVKPVNNKSSVVAKDQCSQDITVENMTVIFGVGASIGSVSPNTGHNCVRRVQFKDINFYYPMKAIYVKTNPGDQGSGEIRDLVYENINIVNPIWYAIYIGPQQQHEPHGEGPGCMTYPFEKCETQPLVDVRNITLKNVTSVGGILPPGLIRCNSTNPCQDINFEDVNLRGWWSDMNWTLITEYAYGSVKNSSPDPMIGKASERVFDLYSLESILKFVDQALGFYQLNKSDILGWETLAGIVIWAAGMAFNGGHFADNQVTVDFANSIAGDPFFYY